MGKAPFAALRPRLPMVPDLAVVIVTHNSAHVLADLLGSLPGALGEFTADVIVVDNASTDGTADLAEELGGCRVVRSANVGYSGGINRGVREAIAAEAILVLNPDVILHEKSVPPLLTALQEPNVGIVVPQLRSPRGNLDLSLRREPNLPRALGLTSTRLAVFSECVTKWSEYGRPHAVDWATGAVLAMSAKCYNALGGWDETFFLYSEETDLSLRARDAGWLTWYEPQSVAVHIGGGSGRTAVTHTMQIVNRVRLYRRRHRSLAAWFYFWLAVASELSQATCGSARSRYAVAALLRPSRRPPALGCCTRLMPM
jgi:N-acetylglucosaminyl-diphospho-decaprenol L-rhamnosyltransferase